MDEQKDINTGTSLESTASLTALNEPAPPKKSPVGGIIIAILVLIIIGLGCYIAYDHGLFNKKKTEETKEEQKVENVEKEITDDVIIKQITDKQAMLNIIDTSIVSPAPAIYKNITNKEITDAEKLYAIISYLDNVERKYSIENPEKFTDLKGDGIDFDVSQDTEFDLKEFYYDDMENGFHVIKGEDVRRAFKSLFGYEPTETKPKNQYPNYYYEKGYDLYMMVSKGGGTCGQEYQQYNYKYTEDNDNIYIYTSIIYYLCDSDIYKDYAMKESVQSRTIDEAVDPSFVKNNLDKLNKYRIVFKKDGDNYVFEKIEEVK